MQALIGSRDSGSPRGGRTVPLGRRRWRLWHSDVPCFRRAGSGNDAPFHAHLDIAAFQFELGNVLLN